MNLAIPNYGWEVVNLSMLLQLRAESIQNKDLIRQFILTILFICLVLWLCRVPTVFGINSAKYWGILGTDHLT